MGGKYQVGRPIIKAPPQQENVASWQVKTTKDAAFQIAPL
jgi:hypothetical protein